jgi:hypothetical protein
VIDVHVRQRDGIGQPHVSLVRLAVTLHETQVYEYSSSTGVDKCAATGHLAGGTQQCRTEVRH